MKFAVALRYLVGSLAVFIRTVDAQAPVQITKLMASDGAAGDLFGCSVSISGETAVLGAVHDNDKGYRSGSAYVFVLNGTVWTQTAKLVASDGTESDLFGSSVSISGDTAIVGAYLDDDKGINSGSAYVFVRSDTAWIQAAKLVASDGAVNDRFGRSVSISGDTAVVGAYWNDGMGSNSGSAYVFIRSGTAWTQTAKLTASDGEANDYFGMSVSISGDTAVVGAPFDDMGNSSGSAYVFVRSGTTWTQTSKLVASDGAAVHNFGYSVSISGDTAVVGAPYDDDMGNSSGSAYVFVRSGTVWTQTAKLVASDGAEGDNFGWSVSISGDTAVVGGKGDDDKGADSGSAYVFVRSGTTWTQTAKLVASNGAASDYFGSSVSISGDTAVVGVHGGHRGYAYAYSGLETATTTTTSTTTTPITTTTTTDAIQSISANVKALTFNDDCDVTFVAGVDIELECSVTSTEGISTKAELKSGNCASNNNFNQEASGSFSTNGTLSALFNLAPLIDTTVRNSDSPIVRFMCFRSDIFSDDGSGTLVSVGAIKYEVEVTIEFARDGTFSVDSIQTAPFVANNASATATRAETVDAYRCDEQGNDASGLVTIGSTLHVCIFSADADVSVAVTSLILQDSSNNILATPVDGTNGRNFVTSIAEKNVAGRSAGVQVVSTLMVPSIFDQAGGEVISASGTASITYTRRVLQKTSSRDLQAIVETAEFEVEFNLMEEDFPAIASKDLESGAIDGHLGGIGVVIGLAVAVFFHFM